VSEDLNATIAGLLRDLASVQKSTQKKCADPDFSAPGALYKAPRTQGNHRRCFKIVAFRSVSR